MDNWMSQAPTALACGLIISIATAWITVRLSLRQFRSERWWERKAEAYASVMRALHEIKDASEKQFEDHCRNGEVLSTQDSAALAKQDSKARERIGAVRDAGSFLISVEAEASLKRLHEQWRAARGSKDYVEFVSAEIEAIEECLGSLRAAAKRDLGVD